MVFGVPSVDWSPDSGERTGQLHILDPQLEVAGATGDGRAARPAD